MKIIFIADAHLKKRDSQTYKNVLAFLETIEGRGNGNGSIRRREGGAASRKGNYETIDDLYIMGDFFDFWFSDGAFIYPEYRPVVERLIDLKEQGVRIHLCEGNHDFFLTDYFAVQLGWEVIKDWAAINIEGRRTLISHGDTVDESNRRYLLLRRILRSGFTYRMQKLLPLSLLWRVAQISSSLSKELTAETADALAAKMRRFSLRKFRDGFDAVILGHCHKHMIENPVVNGNKKTFAILGDWAKNRSYLCYEDGVFTLASFSAAKEQL